MEQGAEYFNKGNYDEAIESFQKALATTDDAAQVYNLLGLAYLKQNKSVKSAIGSFEEAIKANPKYADPYFNLASVYAGGGGDPKLAAEYFQKTIDVDPNYSKAYFGLGWFTLVEKNEPRKALEYFKKTQELFKDFAEAYYGAGLAYIQTGEPHLALGEISALRSMNRDDLANLLENALRQVEPPAPPKEGGSTKPAETKTAEIKKENPVGTTSEVEISMKGRVVPIPEEPQNAVK